MSQLVVYRILRSSSGGTYSFGPHHVRKTRADKASVQRVGVHTYEEAYLNKLRQPRPKQRLMPKIYFSLN